MKYKILFIVKYYFFWLIVFLFQKVVFMLYNYTESFALSFGDWFRVLWHGLRLDLSTAAYFTLVPLLLLTMFTFISNRFVKSIVSVYSYILLVVTIFMGAVDMNLYSYWGFKLDITPLLYLKTPGEAMASVPIMEGIFVTVLFSLILATFVLVFNRKLLPVLAGCDIKSWGFIPIGLFLIAFLIIPIRGGVGVAALNISSAYFHENPFANHSGINVVWNTIYSITEKDKMASRYNFFDDEEAEELFESFYPEGNGSKSIIKENANVLLIVLESFSNKLLSNFGGLSGVAPHLDELCNQSVAFSNFYSSGDRSDKGLVSIFSGFPAQPVASIMGYPAKTGKLPFITKPFSEDGYTTRFYYGGDLDFANFRSYFTNPYIDDLVTGNDFPRKLHMQKWGVPDEFLFEKMSEDISEMSQPFFISCFTLSSHEPFDMPMVPKFATDTRSEMSKNSYYYTDSCLNEFLIRSKKTAWWDNTLVIIMADHGSRTPGNTPNSSPEKYNIPMIWTGGAVLIQDTIIRKYASQTDIAATLLNQFAYSSLDFTYSKDIFDQSSESFANYYFNNGFGVMTDSAQLIFDNTSNRILKAQGIETEKWEGLGKAYLQVMMNDFASK